MSHEHYKHDRPMELRPQFIGEYVDKVLTKYQQEEYLAKIELVKKMA